MRWIPARGQGGGVGIVDRAMTGVFIDVTGRKQAEEGTELLAGEMKHRVKNLQAVAAGLTKVTGRSLVLIDDMSQQMTRRLVALGRAHDLVRPLPGGLGRAALLGDPFTVRLAPPLTMTAPLPDESGWPSWPWASERARRTVG